MIIRSIRLKNIKSYGAGPDGDGVTVRFEPGINRIAGKNGHGKSTLIESLGYALFLTRPIYEEGFDVSTYLLRAGERVGEIDVIFEYEAQAYRVERGLGLQNKRRSKVILIEDGRGQRSFRISLPVIALPGPNPLFGIVRQTRGRKTGPPHLAVRFKTQGGQGAF